jgi:peptidoglycan/LPS O-acetylase OafA/YrhL
MIRERRWRSDRSPLGGKVPMNRRRMALVLLLLFVVCTGIAIVVGKSRSGLDQGVAPAVVQFAGYLCALGAAGLLLAAPREDPVLRRVGAMVLGAALVLVLLDVVLLDDPGPNIGAGLVRVAGLVVIMVATVRLTQEGAAAHGSGDEPVARAGDGGIAGSGTG